ncbi:MAG: sensor histidine kinase [Solirubrobacteraceae bacterium]
MIDPQATIIGHTLDAPDLGPLSSTPTDVGLYRVVTRRVANSRLGYLDVQYARPVSDLDKTIGRLQVFLIFGVLGGTGLAFGAGSMIARRAMAPIAALTAAASEVQRTRDPRRGVPASQSEDEVAELGRTLDGMLQALSGARAETEAMLDRQRAFVADASHELRTPLTSVLANLELLSETLRGEEGTAARSALRSSQRMRRLVEDLLLLARADVGRERVARRFDLADVIVEAAGELGPLSGRHVIELDARPTPMVGARDDVQRVAINLIENALSHTPPGTRVTVSTRPMPGGGAVLTVGDDGPGIPPELAPRLFERFVRGSGDRGGSVGLGLAIVAAVAEAHHGGVSVERSPRGGAHFVVRFGGEAPAPSTAAAEPGERSGIAAT